MSSFHCRSEGPLPVEEVAREYVKVAIEYDAFPANVKYCLAQILVNDLETPLGRKLLSSNTLEDVWYIQPLATAEYFFDIFVPIVRPLD